MYMLRAVVAIREGMRVSVGSLIQGWGRYFDTTG